MKLGFPTLFLSGVVCLDVIPNYTRFLSPSPARLGVESVDTTFRAGWPRFRLREQPGLLTFRPSLIVDSCRMSLEQWGFQRSFRRDEAGAQHQSC